MLTELSLGVKLAIAAVILLLIGYEQYWVFDKGRTVGSVAQLVAATKANADAQIEFAAAIKRQRLADEAEAAENQKQLDKHNLKQVGDLKKANDALKTSDCSNKPLPDAIVQLLNDSDSNGTAK